jgi:hypothetical protein
MRILGFAKDWDKFNQDMFTTFRFEHRGKPYFVGEPLQIKIKPRSKGGGIFKGIAELVAKERRAMAWHHDNTGEVKVTNEEAIADGFVGDIVKPAYFHMWEFLWDYYGGERLLDEPMNKMTLKWLQRGGK